MKFREKENLQHGTEFLIEENLQFRIEEDLQNLIENLQQEGLQEQALRHAAPARPRGALLTGRSRAAARSSHIPEELNLRRGDCEILQDIKKA